MICPEVVSGRSLLGERKEKRVVDRAGPGNYGGITGEDYGMTECQVLTSREDMMAGLLRLDEKEKTRWLQCCPRVKSRLSRVRADLLKRWVLSDLLADGC